MQFKHRFSYDADAVDEIDEEYYGGADDIDDIDEEYCGGADDIDEDAPE